MDNTIMERLKMDGAPVITGSQVTFVWQGESAPFLVGSFTGWTAHPLEMVEAAPGVWTCHVEFPEDAYIEYGFYDPAEDEIYLDPHCSAQTRNGLGDIFSCFYMPGKAPTQWLKRRRGIPRGILTRHRIEHGWLARGSRTLRLYQPPAAGPVPLLLVYDGNDYINQGKILPIMDNLIAAGRIPPLAMALIDHGKDARGVEYACSEATLQTVVERVLPLARECLTLVDLAENPGAYGVLGASMSGLMALYTGLRMPQVFGRVLSQSGAFDLNGRPMVTTELVKHLPPSGIKVWMDAGRYEWLLEPNRNMAALLQDRGYDVVYQEYAGGHNYTCWRNDLEAGLRYLFVDE